VQGFTGREGTFHAQQMIEYGQTSLAALRPVRVKQNISNVHVFDTVAEAVKATGANASVIFVPPPYAADAILEAADAVLPLVICITEGIPVLDMVRVSLTIDRDKTRLIVPTVRASSPPAHAKSASCRAAFTSPVTSASSAAAARSPMKLSINSPDSHRSVHLHRHWRRPIIGTSFLDAIKLFNDDPETHAVILIGEIGGNAEEVAAAWIKANVKKPVVGFYRRTNCAAGSPHGSRRSNHFWWARNCERQNMPPWPPPVSKPLKPPRTSAAH